MGGEVQEGPGLQPTGVLLGAAGGTLGLYLGSCVLMGCGREPSVS